MDSVDKYVRVYQTWDLLQRSGRQGAMTCDSNGEGGGKQGTCAGLAADPCTSSPLHVEMRHMVQKARVEKGMSVVDLAAKVRCQPETLAGFERGGDVLSEDLQRSLRQVLELSSHRMS